MTKLGFLRDHHLCNTRESALPMAKKILGLDICHDGVCAALISSSLKGDRLEDHAYIPLQGADRSSQEFEEAIVLAIEKMDISGAVCVTSLPAEGVSFRKLNLPFGDLKKIRQILPFELEPLIPYPIDDVVTECASVHTSQKASEGNHVLAMAVPLADLQSHIDGFGAARLDPDAVTVSGFPTAFCLAESSGASGTWLLADIRKRLTTLFLILDGSVCDVRTVAVGTESPKRLALEILRTLTAYLDIQRQQIAIERLYLTGSGANDNGIGRLLEGTLKIPVRRIQMIRESGISVDRPLPDSSPPEPFNDALSMALMESKRIPSPNFRQGPFAKKTPWAEYRKSILFSSALAAAVLLMAFVSLILVTYRLEAQVDAQSARIQSIFQQTFPKSRNIVYPAEQLAYFESKLKDKKKLSLQTGVTDRGLRAIDMLLEISRRIPADLDVEFSRLVMSMDSLLISGQTDTFNTVDTIKGRLDGFEAFRTVTITSANVQKSGNRITFKLKIQL